MGENRARNASHAGHPGRRRTALATISVLLAAGTLSTLAVSPSTSAQEPNPSLGQSLAERRSGVLAGARVEPAAAKPARARNCASAPPKAGFDPTASYSAPKLTPTSIVTSVADSGSGSLRSAVASGGVVGFSPKLAGKRITLSSTIELRGSVTIDGSAAAGLVVDAARRGSAFRFNGDSPTRLRFFSLSIVGGRTTGSGGAISVNGGAIDFEVGGVRFESNSAGEGGAIRVGYRSPKIFIHDSTFIDNDGSLTDSGFSGGAISTSGGRLRIVRSRFESNKGSTSGAVYAIHSNPVIKDSLFIRNRSVGNKGSGAFFADGGGPGDYNNGITSPGKITIRRSRFTKNRGAGDDGGAALLYAYPADTVTIKGSAFTRNVSDPGRGGALAIHADKVVRIRKTTFVENRSTGSSGAIRADGSARYRFTNVLFSGNVAEDDFGGAMRLELSEAARLRVRHVTFADNRAKYGNGAIWLPGPRNVRVQNSIFDSNGVAGPQQVNFPVQDRGGNIVWPPTGGTSSLRSAKIADPLLGSLKKKGGFWVRRLRSGSPAIGLAVRPYLATDQRGAARDGDPDSGSRERGASCRR
ncbi:MAG: choice-of-anchor Q domain-containing protein [Nocardioides sp.]